MNVFHRDNAVSGLSRCLFYRRGIRCLAFQDQEVGEGRTQVSVDGEVQVGGTLASVGSRLIQVTANAMLNRFFEAMRQQIAPQGEVSPPLETALSEKVTEGTEGDLSPC